MNVPASGRGGVQRRVATVADGYQRAFAEEQQACVREVLVRHRLQWRDGTVRPTCGHTTQRAAQTPVSRRTFTEPSTKLTNVMVESCDVKAT